MRIASYAAPTHKKVRAKHEGQVTEADILKEALESVEGK